jgi:hypothetical protein
MDEKSFVKESTTNSALGVESARALCFVAGDPNLGIALSFHDSTHALRAPSERAFLLLQAFLGLPLPKAHPDG